MQQTSRTARFMVWFLIIIMVSSIAGFIYTGSTSDTGKIKYNEHKFIRKGDVWVTKLNNKEAIFTFAPQEVLDITIERDIISQLKVTPQIQFTTDQNSSILQYMALVSYELNEELGFHFNKYVQTGFTTNSSYTVPIITCENATALLPVIYMSLSNDTKVYKVGNCIIANTVSAMDALRIKDRLLYGMHGIME